VPDGRDALAVRGEAVNFLHDIVLALDHAGVKPDGLPQSHDYIALGRQFQHQLGLLGQRWREDGTKTIILIDGLDHITREMRPQHSLLDVLPLPEELPEGVLVVLGSQTDEPLQAQIRESVRREPGRRIEMAPLPPGSVQQIIRRADLADGLGDEQQDRVVALCGGHPLALAYLLQQLRDAQGDDATATVLRDAVEFRGRIEEQYAAYWSEIYGDEELVELFGSIARLRSAIDLRWVRKWSDLRVLRRLQAVRQYFRREGERWFFFHNSFRLFLVGRTAEITPSVFDGELDRDIHRELARLCEAEPPESPYAWETLYHLLQAGEYLRALALATQDHFRAQFFAFRPPSAIGEDIQLVVRHALPVTRDVLALARLILIGAEMTERASYLDQAPLPELLVGTKDAPVAAAWARSGSTLLMESAKALSLARRLVGVGEVEEARRIFDLAEPLELLAADRIPIDSFARDEAVVLTAWAEAAPLFREVDDILAMIAAVRVKPTRMNSEGPEYGTQRLRNWLLSYVGHTIIEMGRLDDIPRIAAAFADDGSDEQHAFRLRLYAAVHYHNAGNDQEASRLLDELRTTYSVTALSNSDRVALAEAVFHIADDRNGAAAIIAGLPQPPLALHATGEHGMRPFDQRFRLTRLRTALVEEISPVLLVPDAADARHQGLVYFERAVCEAANIWGSAWRGQQLTGPTITSAMLPALRLFNRRDAFDDLDARLPAQGARGEFFALVVAAARAHGPDALAAMRDAFAREWDDEATGAHWPPAFAGRSYSPCTRRARHPTGWSNGPTRSKPRCSTTSQSLVASRNVPCRPALG